jgi:hypothetical protein
MKNINPNEIRKFFSLMNDNDINYILIKNVADELPYSLKDGKDIDILVHPDSKSKFEEVMIKGNFDICTPPLGVENGWTFGYSLPSYQFWMKRDSSFTLYIDASFVLSCKSLIPKTWVPLNEPINNSVWKEKVFDDKNNWWIMDDKNMLLYLLVRCIFDKKNFSDTYIKEIELRKRYMSDIEDKLKITFYKYSSRLSKMIAEQKYENIIQDYITFDKY